MASSFGTKKASLFEHCAMDKDVSVKASLAIQTLKCKRGVRFKKLLAIRCQLEVNELERYADMDMTRDSGA